MKKYAKPMLETFALVQNKAISSSITPSIEDYLNVNDRLGTDIKESSADSYAFGS